MPRLSFSTMWSQQDRFSEMERFSELVAQFGYDAIEVSHVTDAPGIQALRRGPVPLSSLHAPTPHRFLADGRHNGDANLASIDEDQRRLALSETKRTIDCAAEAGLAYVVVHLGGVGDRRTPEEQELRRLYETGETSGPAWDAAREALRSRREREAVPYLERARRSLEELAEYASPKGVVLGLESRLNYHEIPHPAEAADLLGPYDQSVAGFWHDVGHCEVQSRLGMIDHASWYPAIGSQVIGAHLHDVRGILDHRAPGNGSLDWEMIAKHLPGDALRVLEIDQHEPEPAVAKAGDFLHRYGIV